MVLILELLFFYTFIIFLLMVYYNVSFSFLVAAFGLLYFHVSKPNCFPDWWKALGSLIKPTTSIPPRYSIFRLPQEESDIFTRDILKYTQPSVDLSLEDYNLFKQSIENSFFKHPHIIVDIKEMSGTFILRSLQLTSFAKKTQVVYLLLENKKGELFLDDVDLSFLQLKGIDPLIISQAYGPILQEHQMTKAFGIKGMEYGSKSSGPGINAINRISKNPEGEWFLDNQPIMGNKIIGSVS